MFPVVGETRVVVVAFEIAVDEADLQWLIAEQLIVADVFVGQVLVVFGANPFVVALVNHSFPVLYLNRCPK